MALDYTTTALIANTKRRILTPSAQTMFPDASIVEFLNDALQTVMVPAIKAAREEFFVNIYDQAMVPGQATYDIPLRAFGASLRDVSILDAQGNEAILPHLSPEDVKSAFVYQSPRQLYGFYFEGNKLRITPTPAPNAATLRIKYERRPSSLTQATSTMVITNIDAGLGEVTVSSVPTGLFPSGVVVDFIKNTPYFDAVGDDYAVTGVLANVFTFASLPTGLAVGNYVALSGFSPIPQIPYEGMLVLCQFAAADMLSACGDEKAEPARAKAKEMLGAFIQSVSPRVIGTTKKIVNRTGIFEQGSVSRYW